MKYREQYEAFKKLSIQQGISKLVQLNQALPFGCSVPPSRIDRWLNNLLTLPDGFSTQRRYVNRFKLGADPEFIFCQGGERVNASAFYLAQGLAFGMDNNGRLTVIRPWPSRSALEVTASILTTLRWLALLHPDTLPYSWAAGAFLIGDCLGGHVHFGRKRPNRDIEVKALDAIDDELIAIRAYPQAEVIRRRQGDGRNHPYGLPGDIRLQRHGYEYRTFPSWLDSPELAFLTITLSKLVVHNPSLAQGYIPLLGYERHIQRIKNLLSYYKDVDDDARLALMLISRKMPVHIGGDFKGRWGISPEVFTVPKITFVPSCIQAPQECAEELMNALLNKAPLVMKVPAITWKPLNPPDDYMMTIFKVNTLGAKGLGEMVWDICNHKNFNLIFSNVRDELRHGAYFSFPQKFTEILPIGWQKFCKGRITSHFDDNKTIYSTEKGRENMSECRRLLLETVLPFWKIGDVKPDSWAQWQSTLRSSKGRSRFAGEVLLGDIGDLPFKFN